MSPVTAAIEELSHSPRLPEVVEALSRKLQEEREKRNRFYQEMTPEQKIEFIDGEVVMHSPAKNIHLDITSNTTNLILNYVALHKLGTVKVEKCLVVFPRNDYEPDLVFFGPEKSATLDDDTMRFPVPDFVVEVLSASTEKNDRGVKFEDYAANGVAEYWIIDPDKKVLEQYLLEDETYNLALKAPAGPVSSTVIPGFRCEIEAFFDDHKNLEAIQAMFG